MAAWNVQQKVAAVGSTKKAGLGQAAATATGVGSKGWRSSRGTKRAGRNCS